jgi:uncharacterized protein YodC (DUF2158 family)
LKNLMVSKRRIEDMIQKKQGGPAFPPSDAREGMTLRDWFAGMALQGLLACPAVDSGLSYKTISACAYKHADTMLEQRDL